jgi:hypothetical protein
MRNRERARFFSGGMALVTFPLMSDDTALKQKRADHALMPGVRRYILVDQRTASVTVLIAFG